MVGEGVVVGVGDAATVVVTVTVLVTVCVTVCVIVVGAPAIVPA